MRMVLNSGNALLAMVIAVSGCSARRNATATSAIEIDDADTEGQRFRLSEYRGKAVLLSFWAHF